MAVTADERARMCVRTCRALPDEVVAMADAEGFGAVDFAILSLSGVLQCASLEEAQRVAAKALRYLAAGTTAKEPQPDPDPLAEEVRRKADEALALTRAAMALNAFRREQGTEAAVR